MPKRYDDYIFEGRNKKYGAYRLRKNYSQNLYIGFVSTMVTFIVLSLLWYDYTNSTNFSNPPKINVDMVYVKLPPLDKPTNTTISESKPKFNKKQVTKHEPSHEITNKEIIAIDSIVPEDHDTTSNIDMVYPESHHEGDNPYNYDMGHIHSKELIPTITSIDDFNVYVSNNIIYPTMAKTNKIEGTVYVQFRIDSAGHPINIKVIKGFGYGCDEETIRLVKNSPKWMITPTELIVHIRFSL